MYRLWAHASSSGSEFCFWVLLFFRIEAVLQPSHSFLWHKRLTVCQPLICHITKKILLQISHECWPFRSSQQSLNADPYAWSWIFLSLRFCFLRNVWQSFPLEVLWKLDSLRGPLIGGQLKESPQTGGRGFRGTFPPLDKVSTTGVWMVLVGTPSQDLQKPLWGDALLY